jgi:hypothetical protein
LVAWGRGQPALFSSPGVKKKKVPFLENWGSFREKGVGSLAQKKKKKKSGSSISLPYLNSFVFFLLRDVLHLSI